jgi:heme-degrading monooxygenase HmoA
MSKEIKARTRSRQGNPIREIGWWPVGILLIVLTLTAISIVPGGAAQPAPQQPAATTGAARNAALIAATQEVLKETSEVRQLAILRPVQSSTQSRSEIERAVMKNLDEEVTPADMHAAEVTLKKLGLAPPEFQYRALMIRLLTEQVAGYYEPKSRQFYLADWIDVDGQKPIMAHELTHALQDQHFNLRRFDHWPKGDSDAELAAHALIEGDATMAMAMYVASNPLRALTFLKSMGAMSIATEELDKAPRSVRESLLFPYQEGMNFTRALYKQGGWPEVSKAFTTLPQSTEQILHADKYFAREAPVKVLVPDITSLLNSGSKRSEVRSQRSVAGFQAATTWKRLAADVNGEWGFYLILDEFLKSAAESRRAAAGWAGDRTSVYESQKGDVLYVSLSAWDTENDAREFFDAYVKRTQLRYPAAETSTGSQQSVPGLQTFRTPEGLTAIEVRGSRVLIVDGVTGEPGIDALLKALRQGN